MIPVQMARVYFEKEHRKSELSVLFLSVLFSIVQIYFILSTKTSASAPAIDIEFLQTVVIKFFGLYYLNGWGLGQLSYLLGGLALILFITYKLAKNKDLFLFILVYLLIASILMSVARAPLNVIDPFQGGARYFFFPYILISWILLYLIDRFIFIIAFPILALSVYSSFDRFGRTHDELNWRMHLASCAANDGSYSLPIHAGGDIASVWHITLTSEKCNSIIDRDFFKMSPQDRAGFLIDNKGTYQSVNEVKSFIYESKIQKSTYRLNGTYEKTPLEGFEVFGSYITGDNDLAKIQFLAVQGDSFLIKTGPTTTHQKVKILDKCGYVVHSELLKKSDEWQIYKLMKSNLMPENVIVEIEDNGAGWGEWSAVALKKD